MLSLYDCILGFVIFLKGKVFVLTGKNVGMLVCREVDINRLCHQKKMQTNKQNNNRNNSHCFQQIKHILHPSLCFDFMASAEKTRWNEYMHMLYLLKTVTIIAVVILFFCVFCWFALFFGNKKSININPTTKQHAHIFAG